MRAPIKQLKPKRPSSEQSLKHFTSAPAIRDIGRSSIHGVGILLCGFRGLVTFSQESIDACAKRPQFFNSDVRVMHIVLGQSIAAIAGIGQNNPETVEV